MHSGMKMSWKRGYITSVGKSTYLPILITHFVFRIDTILDPSEGEEREDSVAEPADVMPSVERQGDKTWVAKYAVFIYSVAMLVNGAFVLVSWRDTRLENNVPLKWFCYLYQKFLQILYSVMRNLKKASKEAPGPVQDKEEGEGEAGDVVDDGEIPGPSNVSKIPVSFTVFHFLSAFPVY